MSERREGKENERQGGVKESGIGRGKENWKWMEVGGRGREEEKRVGRE